MDSKLLNLSVTKPPRRPTGDLVGKSATLLFSQVNNIIESWYGNTFKRDKQLKEFVFQEPWLMSSIYSIVTARAALNWELEGPPKTVRMVQQMLLNADMGKGWISLIQKVTYDLLTADNGAFIEVIRKKARPGRKPESAPVIGLVHLDSQRCIRTNSPLTPVYYVDDEGLYHALKWYQVITLEEMPSPDSDYYNKQVCFVSRVLNAASIIKNITQYEDERVAGRFTRRINLVGGVAQHNIDQILERGQMDADNQGLTRFMPNLILAALDPNAKVSKETIDFAELPENFNKDDYLKHYITLLALASGTDFQELAPLPGGNLGTASQSETLHKKSRVKGILLFIKLIEQKFYQAKVIPPSVTFTFVQKDLEAEVEATAMSKSRAETRALRIGSGEITVDVARQQAVDSGDLKTEYLIMLGNEDITPSVTIEGTEPVSEDLIAVENGQVPEAKSLPVKNAWLAAKWFTRLIEEHPAQAISPINEAQLGVFTENLRNLLTKESRLYTTEGWQSPLLTRAALESGIHTHVLRYRLPDSYVLNVSAEKVWDNRGNLIYQAPKKEKQIHVLAAQIAKGERCEVCGGERYIYNYLPLKGWVPSCEKHYQRGLKGAPTKVQFNYSGLVETFKRQYPQAKNKQGLYLATLQYAYQLGFNTKQNVNFETVREIHQRKQVLLQAETSVESLISGLLEAYFAGLAKI